MARSWPTARIPEPVLTARTGPSRTYGLALARRITATHAATSTSTANTILTTLQGNLVSLNLSTGSGSSFTINTNMGSFLTPSNFSALAALTW